jgi:hypothetical protein
MSNKAKLIGFILGGISASIIANAATSSSITDQLYSDSIYMERSSAEVPGSIESSARENESSSDPAPAANAVAPRYEKAIESVADLDQESARAPSTTKRKKN